MNYNYKYQVSQKQAFGAPPPKKRQKYAPTNRLSQGYANAIRAANTNGYIASANMMSYKSGADYAAHNQPLMNTRLLRLKNDPITLNETYYGKKFDPVEVRNFKFAKGPNAYIGHPDSMRFGMYHMRNQNDFVVPPAPAFAGPHGPATSADIANAVNFLLPRIDYIGQQHPTLIGNATADALIQKGFIQHPLPQQQGQPLNPLLPTPSTPSGGGRGTPQGGTPPPGVSPPSSPQPIPAAQGKSKYNNLIAGYADMSKSQKKKAREVYNKQQSQKLVELQSPTKTRSGTVRNLDYPSAQDLSLVNQVQNPDQRQDMYDDLSNWGSEVNI